ncbi:TIGR01621 family pseudouridine synthase [Pseudoalteromonas denitrificans]|jgi:tRNA pseudouridine32 synthase/23S rRNA pseudouridine746 synthase|uniref:tRNA pseudouridine32 synthase / 23S rRNA pseudouridine746 synthase n=1 Tax=Pseudoalteromonas denitrificans DSM 6059 TaxID=1123010 RepID=A0A1I1NG31_9GAMM|nr:TIGR01621 family pseudouridine synthase [Pseudoalteromonas denitrificans]SFC96487.1 tRNA pseudouridine32 synthase / 23S rRNA pseudouridine746 synthase [Pseudoalteromonas denitrificans DSM 6059]
MAETLKIAFEHTDFIIFEKPAGLSFHSEDGPGFVVQAQTQMQQMLYSVHRLDKVTSGLIILAKSKEAAAKFTELFTQNSENEKHIEKFYLALSRHKPKKKQGWIKGDMVKARRGAYKLLTSKVNPAVTRFYSHSVKPGLRAFLLKPYTGKTHQLRVALKSLGAPILGDVLYADSDSSDRVYLHAFALKFNWQGDNIEVVNWPKNGMQYMSEEFKLLYSQWKAPWQYDW